MTTRIFESLVKGFSEMRRVGVEPVKILMTPEKHKLLGKELGWKKLQYIVDDVHITVTTPPKGTKK